MPARKCMPGTLLPGLHHETGNHQYTRVLHRKAAKGLPPRWSYPQYSQLGMLTRGAGWAGASIMPSTTTNTLHNSTQKD